MTVKQFLDAWVRDTLSVSGLDPRTIGNYERAVRLRLVPALGKVKLAKLTPMHVQRFVGAQLAAGVGPTAVQQALTTLRMATEAGGAVGDAAAQRRGAGRRRARAVTWA
jgi:hypothetical protein